MSRGHCWLDHTADLALEVWAESEPGLLEEAARALVIALTEGHEPSGPAVRDTITLVALDPEDRLVRWLNEVLFLATARGVFVERASITLTPPGALHAAIEARDAGSQAVTAEIKSATYHALSLVHEDDRVVAHVVLDV